MLKRFLCSPLIQIFLMSVLILAGMLWPSGLFERLEYVNYDFWSARFRAPEDHSVAIVAIDEKSIGHLGGWPWPRSRIQTMVELLTKANAQSLGVFLLYTQPYQDPGLKEIRALQAAISDTGWKGDKQCSQAVMEMLQRSQKRLDRDIQMISAVRRTKNSVFPIRFSPNSENVDKPSDLLIINSLKKVTPTPAYGRSQTFLAGVHTVIREKNLPIVAQGVQETFGPLAENASALGHINLKIDRDGVVRRLPLLVNYHDRLYPALAFQLALKQIQGKLGQLSLDTDLFGQPNLKIRRLTLSTDNAYHMLASHDDQWTRERTYSFSEVLDGTVDPAVFQNQVVLVGGTDPNIVPVYRVGAHWGVSNVEINANIIGRILSEVRLSRPGWAPVMEMVVLFYFAVFLIFFIPGVNFRLGISTLAIFLMTWYAIGVGLLLGYGYWIKFFGPALLACLGFVTVQLTIFSRVRQQEKLESNKTLGLTYQGQGMLDMAFEKYMLCPASDKSVKHLMYNLGLDFERKRMFNKAVAIYQHIRSEGTYRDIKDRITRLNVMDDPLSMTGNNVGEVTVKGEGDTTTKPTFGRYEILKELGHGAMGTVYVGQDPKINRKVAIKTLEYTQVEASELEEVKARFFREAEAAGKLSHPNIVSIFDAGEEHDMAYIAMELLTGSDLTGYCRKDNLLAVPQIIDIISQVTLAMNYAHQQGVVHRDIKPGNIMLMEDHRVKVTDFGIARVVDASRTGTGVVLGTPSYMSPEQVIGQKVDGRSDLFSLGIVFYQLLTGAKPFTGDSITAIMYAITHHRHTPLSAKVSHIPVCIESVVNKLLTKSINRRFQSAVQLVEALEACKREL